MLEKILEEIDAHAIEFEAFGVSDDYISVGWVKDIIRKHMKDDNDGWIQCEECLPDEPYDVLVSVHNIGLVTIGRYLGNGKWDVEKWITGLDKNDVRAWRPLPNSYRPEKGAGE